MRQDCSGILNRKRVTTDIERSRRRYLRRLAATVDLDSAYTAIDRGAGDRNVVDIDSDCIDRMEHVDVDLHATGKTNRLPAGGGRQPHKIGNQRNPVGVRHDLPREFSRSLADVRVRLL